VGRREVVVLTSGSSAAVNPGKERRLGVGQTALGVSPSPSAALGRRSRGEDGVVGAVDLSYTDASPKCRTRIAICI
jgi:hypothetical protein